MKKLLMGLTIAGVLLAIAAYWVSPSKHPGGDVLYTFAEVERGSMLEVVSATGQLSPREVSLVFSPIPGEVKEIYGNADYNHYVRKGEALFVLDQSLARVKVEQGKAAVEAAKADVERAEATRDAAQKALDYQLGLSKEIRLKTKVEEATYNLNAARAAVEAAKAKVAMAEKAQKEAQIGFDKTTVRAHAAGVIIDKKIYTGQMVGPQAPAPLFKIASDLSEMEVNAQVAEGDTSKIQAGMEATFTVYAYSDQNTKFEGRVKQIHYLPTSVQGAVFYNTLITVKNRRTSESEEAGAAWLRSQASGVFGSALSGPLRVLPWLNLKPEEPDTWMLRPGMTATVDIIRRRHHDVWKLPLDAVNMQMDEAYWTSSARAKIEDWKKRKDKDDWKLVWVLGAYHKPWPLFARVGGVNKAGEAGIRDGQFIEVLEWDPDPEAQARIDPKNPGKLKVITSAPPAHKPGLFDRPTKIGIS